MEKTLYLIKCFDFLDAMKSILSIEILSGYVENKDFELDKSQRMRVESGLNGYGVEIVGKSAEDRLELAKSLMEGKSTVINCRSVDSDQDFTEHALEVLRGDSLADNEIISEIDIDRELQNQNSNIVIHNFDSMSPEQCKNTAQVMKGVAERLGDSNVMIAYTCSESGKVVESNFDLSARIRTFDIDDLD